MRDQPALEYRPARKVACPPADPRVVGVPAVHAAVAEAGLEPVADRAELPVGELEQPGGEGEPPVEVGHLLRRHRALVADVVLELGPGVLEHRAQLDRGAERAGRMPSARRSPSRHQQVPAGVAEPTRRGGLLAEVAVVENGELLGEQVGDGVHVALDVGDDPDADLVGDRVQRVGAGSPPVERRRAPWRRTTRPTWCDP